MDYSAIATVGLAFAFAIGTGAICILIGRYQAKNQIIVEIGRTADAQIDHWRRFKEPLPTSKYDGD